MARRPRLAKMTPQACLDAVVQWFATEDVAVGSASLIAAGGMLWLEMRDLTMTSFGETEEEASVVRAVLVAHEFPMDRALPHSAMLVELYTKDPTPRREQAGFVTSIMRSEPYRRLAIVATSEGVDAREIKIVPSDWGVKMVWPFND